jgi:hypothetical protein
MSTYNTIPNVNAHLHTPFSFSAFEQLSEALERACDENVQVVGINDFYSTDGYEDWNNEALRRNLYPLFNIELISLQKEDQDAGIRVNDPNNPGRTYISGKGLSYPSAFEEPYATLLQNVREESNRQTKLMCDKLNELLLNFNSGFNLDYEIIKSYLTKGLVRERHLAKALRMETYMFFKNNPADIKKYLDKIFGKELKSDIYDFASVENEIRGNLLKANGAAFVPESPEAFPSLEDVKKIILAGGGIPTYPFLADDAKGNFTDFEKDIEKAAEILKQKRIFSTEFITTRNSIEVLEKYAGYLFDNGFVVTFGSEHNTPAMEPILLYARNNTPLTDKLKHINAKSACVIAAHQDRIQRGLPGYVDKDGNPNSESRDVFIEEGRKLIRKVIQE